MLYNIGDSQTMVVPVTLHAALPGSIPFAIQFVLQTVIRAAL